MNPDKCKNCPSLGKTSIGPYGLHDTPYCEYAPNAMIGDRRIWKMKNCPKAMEGISGNKEEIPSNSCNSDKNLQGFDADYLQSKIDAFTEARKKDGKTADEVLEECRGGALELTWQDIQKIWEIGVYIVYYNSYHNIQIEDEAFFKEILNRYINDSKKVSI